MPLKVSRLTLRKRAYYINFKLKDSSKTNGIY
ncbi:hypothetical protein ROSI111154_09085 [Rouxiella silvae]